MNTQLIELRKLAEAATPGPWIAGDEQDSDYFLVGPPSFDAVVTNPVVTLHALHNAEFIAAANPAKVIELVDAIEALEREIERMTAESRSLAQSCELLHSMHASVTEERDTLRSRLDALSGQEAVAYVKFKDGEVDFDTDDNIVISNTPGDCVDESIKWLPVFASAPQKGGL